MTALPAQFRRLLILTLVWNVFLPWYLLERPLTIIRSYLAYARAWGEIFSFVFLFRTLFSPWKHLTEDYPSNSLALGRISYVFAVNMVARGVGFVVRVIAIVLGLLVQVTLFVVSLLYLIVWMLFPVLAVTGVHYLQLLT